MKKYYIPLVLLIFLIPLPGCEDWFDVHPKSQVKSDDLFETEVGFKRALIGVYTLLSDGSTYGGNGTVSFIEVLAGTYTSVNNSSNSYNSCSRYIYDSGIGAEACRSLWSNNYNAIANINNLLENIEGKKNLFAPGIYEIIKGEALGLRAYIHFDLLRNFAPAPIHGLQSDGIPYVDAISTVPFPQLNLEEVLARVITDLEAAEQLLKDYDPIGPAFEFYEEQNNGYTPIEDVMNSENFLLFRKERMNYYAVLATLARVYLYRGTQEDMTRAYTYANKVINSAKIPLFESAVIENLSYPLSLFTQEYIFSLYKRNIEKTVNEKFFYTSGENDLSIDDLTRNKYYETEKYGGAADVRLNKLFGIKSDGFSKYLAKYAFESRNINRIPLIKISEMYLIAAEATESMDHLVALRRMRGLKNMIKGTTLQEEIAAEYRKEFIGEGQMFYYFKRKNQLVNENMKNPSFFALPIPTTEEERGLIN